MFPVASVSWMGRYRHLIESIVRHRNAFARVMNAKTEKFGDISMSIVEWEVLEYIIEHENDDSSMAQLSERLMIPSSSFSKISKTLCSYGLIEKYQMVNNRKNIILKPSDLGRKFYNDRASDLQEQIFDAFFKELENVSDEDLNHFAVALDAICPSEENEKEYMLIKRESNL